MILLAGLVYEQYVQSTVMQIQKLQKSIIQQKDNTKIYDQCQQTEAIDDITANLFESAGEII